MCLNDTNRINDDKTANFYMNKCQTFLKNNNLVEALNSLDMAINISGSNRKSMFLELKETILKRYWDIGYDIINKGNIQKGFRYINIVIRQVEENKKIEYLNKKIDIIYEFNLKDEAMRVFRNYFDEFLNDKEKYKNIEACKDLIVKSKDKILITEIRSIIRKQGIPSCFIKISMRKFLNVNFLSKLFEKSIEINNIILADQCMEYINNQKSTNSICWKSLAEYYRLKNDNNKVLKCYDSILIKNPYDKEALLNKANFIKRSKSFDYSLDNLKKYINLREKKASLEQLIDLILVFKDFYLENYYGKDLESWRKHLGFLKNSKFLMESLYPVYEVQGEITEESIKNLIFRYARENNDIKVKDGLNLVKKHFKFNDNDYIKLVNIYYDNLKLNDALKYINIILDKPKIEWSILKATLNKQIYIYKILKDDEKLSITCNEYIKKMGYNYEFIKTLIDSLIKLERYEECIEKCTFILNEYKEALSKENKKELNEKKTQCLKALGKSFSILNVFKS